MLSSLGLEVVLLSSLMAGLVAAGLRGRPVGFGVLSGLAVLARLDMIIFVLAVALLAPLVRRRLLLTAAVATALPWFAWSWWVLGSAIPDTFVIKTLQRSFAGSVYRSGLWAHYKPMNAVAVWAHVVPALVGLGVAVALAVRSVRRPASREHGALLGLALVASCTTTLAFVCECSIVGPFADRALMTPLISQRVEHAGPLMRWLLRMNYARRDTSVEPDPVAHRLLWVTATDPANTAGPSRPTNSPRVGPGWLVLLEA